MNVEITYINEEGKTTKRIIENIWEVRDNGDDNLVIKDHNYMCEHFKFENIKELKMNKE